MLKNQKGFSPIILIIAVAILVGIGVYIWKINKSPLPITPQPSDQTTNWKTYTFSSGDFNFEYPDNWHVGNPPPYVGRSPGGFGDWISLFPNGEPEKYSNNDIRGNESLRIIYYGGGNDLNFNNFKNQGESAIIGNKQAVKNVSDSLASVDILVKKTPSQGDQILHLEFGKTALSYVDQILSTFKFTN